MMQAILHVLPGEVIKLRRTLALRMIVVAPALVILLSLSLQWAALARGRGDLSATMWDSLPRNALTFWAVFLLPFLITLETALLCGVEHTEKQWKHLFALPVPRAAIYWAKLVVVQGLTLASTALLCGAIVLAGWCLTRAHPAYANAGPPPVLSIASHALECWLAASLILSTNLWIALRWPSFTVPLATGVAGTFFALFAASAEGSRFYPWLLPMNVLAGGDRRLAALGLGIGGGLLVALLGCIDFVRREEGAPARLSPRWAAAWALLLAGCAAMGVYLDGRLLANPLPAHSIRFVAVEREVKLEVIDWGGTGQPIVLLAGLGDTAHVFHRFAGKLTANHRVYGITRRGFGASSVPGEGYSVGRLADDVLAVIEELKLERPVLAGHSIAGQEISSIGSRHPEKVAGLVYLDAAYAYAFYDATRGDFHLDSLALQRKLDLLRPGTATSDPGAVLAEVVASLPGFERVLRERVRDMEAMAGQGGAGFQVSAFREREKPGLRAAQAILAGQQKHTTIGAPILAIYALPHSTAPVNKRFAKRDRSSITGPQANAFEKAFPQARVVRLQNASHYVFQSHEAEVLGEIRSFVRNLPRR